MNLVIVPFHDWRKILKEGFRTRDAHFIDAFARKKSIVQIVVNRPTTPIEILFKKKRNLIKGKVLLKRNGFRLYNIDEDLYLIDYVSWDIVGQILQGYNWFISQYGNPKYVSFINEVLAKLAANDDYTLLNQNIFAQGLTAALRPKTSVFDAWDNFTKFNLYKKIRHNLENAYMGYAQKCDFWVTNSRDNVVDFTREFGPKKIFLITNGADVERFQDEKAEVPEDIRSIPRPIVGFGGKMTHLIDVGLLNRTMDLAPEASFVFVGQILDKDTFSQIEKRDNFHYLGDKHYDVYPNYVKNFDVCIVPYVVEKEKKSGANTIKVYEYLASNKKVVGTNGNGLEDLRDFVYIVSDEKEFASEIMDPINYRAAIELDGHSWQNKADFFLTLIT